MRESDKVSSLMSSRDKALLLLRVALSKKAVEPVLVRLIGLTSITDYFLLVSGNSAKQVQAIAEAVLEDAKKHKIDRLSAEGVSQGNWALLDYGGCDRTHLSQACPGVLRSGRALGRSPPRALSG